MSTTRSQKRRNDQQEGDRNVSEGFVSPIVAENSCSSNQDVEVAGPSRPKSPRIENSFLENLRTSLKEEITSEIKSLLIESQKEVLELLKPKTRENIRDNFDEETENESRSFYTPTKSVRINSTQNDPNISRNNNQAEKMYNLNENKTPAKNRDIFRDTNIAKKYDEGEDRTLDLLAGKHEKVLSTKPVSNT